MFKRNQVEAAIGAVFGEDIEAPSDELRTRIKRLLNTDRSKTISDSVGSVGRYAFYSQLPPGSGVEIWFSHYETFALLMGLQLMQHGWTQSFVVDVLRHIRPKLQAEHRKILALDARKTFERPNPRARLAGEPIFESNTPSFLVLVLPYGIDRKDQQSFKCAVHDKLGSAMEWIGSSIKGVGGGSAIFELTLPAFQLSHTLSQTTPRTRGRAP